MCYPVCMITSFFTLIVLSTTAFAADWKPLFNGKDLSGWKHVGEGSFVVVDGLLRTQGGMGLLYWTGGKVRNGTIRVVYRAQNKIDNSGVFIRIPIEPREAWMPVHYGHEVQIDAQPERWGEDGRDHTTGTVYTFSKPLAKADKLDDWNTLEITIKGPRTISYLNGVKVSDYTEGDKTPEVYKGGPARGPRPAEGFIGLQNHGEKDIVEFREISLKR